MKKLFFGLSLIAMTGTSIAQNRGDYDEAVNKIKNYYNKSNRQNKYDCRHVKKYYRFDIHNLEY